MSPLYRLTDRLKKNGWLVILILLAFLAILALWLRWQLTGTNPASPVSIPTAISTEFDGILRITVREPGIFALTHEDLKPYELHTVSPTDLRLFNMGKQHPLWYSGEGSMLQVYFYGFPLDNPYTVENVYFLTTKDTPLSQSIELPPSTSSRSDYQAPTTLPIPLHLEENILYLPKADPNHTWFWKNLTAPKTEIIQFDIPQIDPGEARIRVAVFANTEAGSINPDHHLRLHLNDSLVLDQTWDGRSYQIFEQALPATLLQTGNNTLAVELPGDTGSLVETVLLDWISISYPHLYVENHTRAEFRGTGKNVSLTVFDTSPFIFDLSRAGEDSPLSIQPVNRDQFPTEADHLYIAVSPEGLLQPSAISPAWQSPDLRAIQGDYLAIGPPDLLEPLQPLLEHREAQGLTSLSIPIQAIYDQFSGGIAHPEAIRSFLKYAYQNWDTPPKYVLLVGDSTYDPRGFIAVPEANRVPSFFRYTFFGGETVSDIAFAQLDGDKLPDLIVGRIPARTVEQVSIIVEKTLSYEQSPIQGKDRILAIADGQEESFTSDAQTFLDKFPATYTPVLLTPPKGESDAPQQIQEALAEGVLFMSYFGHGSISMLGKDRIFSIEDGQALSNYETLPIMINSTCLAGLFTHPEAESLTEAMLWNPNGGAVAALSATSLTLPLDQAYLTNAFVQAFAENPDATLGELLLIAQRQIPLDQEGVREVVDTFLLFGDPALRLP